MRFPMPKALHSKALGCGEFFTPKALHPTAQGQRSRAAAERHPGLRTTHHTHTPKGFYK
jgi:hypothetical protein